MLALLLVLFLTVLNGFFSMSEMALVSSKRLRLQALADKGSKGAQAALDLSEDPSRFLSAVQIGITLVGVLAGAIGNATLADPLAERLQAVPFITPYAGEIAVALVVLGITVLSIVVGELVPKRLALADPEGIARRIARPMAVLARVASPVVALMGATSSLILRLLGSKPKEENSVTQEEVHEIIEEGAAAGVIAHAEKEIVSGVIGLNDEPVTAIMTPRRDVDWIDLDDAPGTVRAELLGSPYSRLLVARGGAVDEPLGYVHKKDLFAQLVEGRPMDVEACLRQPLFAPEGTSVLALLEEFRRSREHVALVVDEYGTLEGMATLTDVLEAFAGEIPEEHERAASGMHRREDGSWLVDGRLSLDALEETLGVTPEADGRVHTVAGLVLEAVGRVPSEGDSAEVQGWVVEVMDMDGRRIDKVLFRRPAA